EEIAFVRYYTVTLLSENLYFFTLALTVYCVVRFVQHDSPRWLAGAAVAAGVSALTRPAMMLYLLPSAAIVGMAGFRHRRRLGSAAAASAAFVAIWIVTLLPATYRNYVAAGAPVLISAAPALSFINYNVPPDFDVRIAQKFTGSALSALRVLGEIAV